jgi:hypothetical protein
MLVVIAIIGVVIVLTIPAVTTLSKAGGVNAGGRLISNLLTTARSEAINRRTRVQLRVVTKWMNGSAEDGTVAYRKMSIWTIDPIKTAQIPPPVDLYSQASKWETLPSGIIIDPTVDPTTATPPYTFAPSSNPSYPGTYFLDPTLANRTTSVSIGSASVDFVWVQFDPSGAANFPGKGYLLVTEGILPNAGASLVYTHAGHPNWFATSVTGLTGRIVGIRP